VKRMVEVEQKRRYLYMWMIIAFVVFIIISTLILIILNPPARSTAVPLQTSESEIRRVSIANAKEAFDSGSAIFVDVRDSGTYGQAHIPGALSIPLSEITNHLDEIDPSNWIITYCT
jgi:Rhodanese-like domain